MVSKARIRVALGFALAAVAGGCASTTQSAWDRADLAPSKRAPASIGGSTVCPVVLSNQTDQQLNAGYVVGGVESVLGLIPAGRSLSFRVSCSPGSIEAFAYAPGGFLGGDEEYRTSAHLAPERHTKLGFTVVNRIR